MIRYAVLLAALPLAPLAHADAIDDYVRGEMARQHIPGLSLGIIKNGRLVSKRAYGQADLELSVPAKVDDLYEIGSITKSFTAIAAMMLVEEGKLGLDDPISKYIPEAPAAWGSIRVRNLLYQTSGLKDYAFIEGIGLVDSYDRAKWMGEMTKLPLDFEPGQTWSYSNSNYALMGWIIEKAAGKSYTEFVRERLFQPAGMTHTVFGDSSAILPRHSHGYMSVEGKIVRSPYGGMSIDSDGSILSNVSDMAKWDVALRAGKFLSPAGWKTILSPARLASGREINYGMGWNLSFPMSTFPYMGHGGNSAGYSAGFVRYPSKGLSVVVLCNLYPVGGEPTARRIAEITDPAVLPTTPRPITDPDPARTARVREALTAYADHDGKSDLLDPELSIPFRTERSQRGAPSVFRDMNELLYAGESSAPGGTWLAYRLRKGEKWFTVRLLWTPEARLAQIAARADLTPPTPGKRTS